ncbi:MAG: ABC transporter ATP-binding protein [Pseudomonadota bacterium]
MKAQDKPGGLAIVGVVHAFDGGPKVVDEVTLHVGPGELVGLVGPSGCGKTTLLRIAAGLEELQQGSVVIDGAAVAHAGYGVPTEARGVGLVFQDYALFPHLTVAGNVLFGLSKLPVPERRARVREILHQVGMSDYADAWPHQLSGGQQQRVALARALAPRPRVMLLDEPFSGLDLRLREQIRDDTLHVLKTTGVATLMVTHDPEEAMFMADRIAIMRQGRIEQAGRPAEVYGQPASAFVASFFGQVNRLAGVVRGGVVGTLFGSISAPGYEEGTRVEVLIRPETLKLAIVGDDDSPACPAKVLAARLLGRSSWIHLCLGRPAEDKHWAGIELAAEGEAGHVHFHARVPGRFLPPEGEILSVGLDPTQAFVFAAGDPT